MSLLRITVNGQEIEREIRDSRYLAEFLRYDLGLTGTKIGCNEAECGACTVLVDGVPVDSCVYPVWKAQGRRVETIEGMAAASRKTLPPRPSVARRTSGYQEEELDRLHPLQVEFVRHGAVQCGFCIPGMILTARALIDANPEPSEADIRVALKDTFCRCAGYPTITRAIQSAAAILRGEPALPVMIPESNQPLNVVGTNVIRPEAVAKVTGEAIYTDDIAFPDQLYGRTLRATYPHAYIRSIDTSRARALEGVVAVLTADDVPGRLNHGLVYQDWPALARDKVRYIGDAVAIVAAERPEIAQQALDLIGVSYEPIDVVDGPEFAMASNAPLVHEEWEKGNTIKHIKVRQGDVAEGFALADVVVERTYHTATTDHAFMEPECAIGVPAGFDTEHEKLTIYVGSQIPYADRNQVAAALGIPERAVRIVSPLVGGGFGGKEDIAGQIHVAMLAQATGRPVKMLYTRQESLRAHPKRHATVIRMKMGASKEGDLIAVQATLYGDGGAYASLSDKVMTRATTHATGPYVFLHAKIDCYANYTNNPPSGAFRGFGVTQSAFAVEQTIDMLAEKLGMDPLVFRRRNAMRTGSTTATGQLLTESVGLLQTIDIAEEQIWRASREEPPVADNPFAGMSERPPVTEISWRDGNKVYSWGVASAYKNTGLGGGAPDKSAAIVEVYPNGTAEVRTSAAEIGQGLVTILAQTTAEELGLPYQHVRVLLSDTDLTPDGGPTTASRQTYVTGNAARMAAGAMREALVTVVAEDFDVPPEQVRFEEGLVRANGHEITFGQAVQRLVDEGREPRVHYEYMAPRTQPLGTGGNMHFAFSFATQAALVEVDLSTGEVHVLRIIAANDVGKAFNPIGLQGQVEGGVMMGLGNALTEEFIMEEGIPFTDVLARYKMPSIKHTPRIDSIIVEEPAADGPYGAKGVGELSSIPTTPAICNAIYNATGVRVFRLPVDQDALLMAMKLGRDSCS